MTPEHKRRTDDMMRDLKNWHAYVTQLLSSLDGVNLNPKQRAWQTSLKLLAGALYTATHAAAWSAGEHHDDT